MSMLLEHVTLAISNSSKWVPDQTCNNCTCEPARGFDLGAGNGKKVTHEVRGGTVGLIIDGRGRPLGLPEDRQQCQQTI